MPSTLRPSISRISSRSKYLLSNKRIRFPPSPWGRVWYSIRFDDCQCCQSDLDLPFYSSEWITQRALDRLDQWNCDQPFCMMVGCISPHHPFDPPAPYSTMYDPNSLHLLPGYTDQPLPFDSNFGISTIRSSKFPCLSNIPDSRPPDRRIPSFLKIST